MKRIDWLRTFLKLADSNAPAIDYRKRLRLMTRQLPGHVASIPRYREELAALEAEEAEAALPKSVGSTLESFLKEEGIYDESAKRASGTTEEQAVEESAGAGPSNVCAKGNADCPDPVLGGTCSLECTPKRKRKSSRKSSKTTKQTGEDSGDSLGHSNYRG